MAVWTMISLEYARLPKTTKYKMRVKIDRVSKEEGKSAQILNLGDASASGVEMSDLVLTLHQNLRDHPDAKVTMLQTPTREPQFSAPKPQGQELDQRMVDLIRNDLQAAQKMFQPIEQRVVVTPPRLAVKQQENDDG